MASGTGLSLEMLHLEEPADMLGQSPDVFQLSNFMLGEQPTKKIFQEPKFMLHIDERNRVPVRCPFCCIVQNNLKKCNSCHRNIPPSANTHNTIYSHPPPPELGYQVKYRGIENPLQSKRKEPIFSPHPNNSFRESLREIARSAVIKQQNNEDTIDEERRKRCTFEEYWRYCSRCNPEMKHIKKSDGSGKCTKDDLKTGLEFIMDYMEFSEEEDPEGRVLLEKKKKNPMHPHSKVAGSRSDIYNSGSSEKQNADMIIKGKEKTEGAKTHVASNKSSHIIKKGEITSTMSENKNSHSVQSVNIKKQRKSDKVSFTPANNLQVATDKSMNATNHAINQDSTTSKKLNVRKAPQGKPDMAKDTKLPYGGGKEFPFMNVSKNAHISKSKMFSFAPSRNQNSTNVKNEVCKKPDMSITSDKTNNNKSDTSRIENKPHPIRSTLVPKTIPTKDSASSLKNIQRSSNTSFDHKNVNLDTENLISIKKENEIKGMPSSSEKFHKLSSTLPSDHKKIDLDTKIPVKNENKITVMSSLSGKPSELSSSLPSDLKQTDLNTKIPVKNENEITVVPSSSGKLSEISSSLPSDLKQTDLDTKIPVKNITAIPSSSEKLSENVQLALTKLEYPILNKKDLECLHEKNELNDAIIEFYLKYIFNEKLTPELQEKTYICNPFFYPKVLKEQSVESWLKDVDLFSKDFILIPVNVKSAHWYLVIVCFLSKIPKINPRTESNEQQKSSNSGVTDKRTCFCFFDSFYTEKGLDKEKLAVVKKLRNFLKTFWLTNHKYETCEWKQLNFFNFCCPQQENNYDCGLFLLEFAESFFQKPIEKFEDGLDLTGWFNQEMVTEKRKEIKKIIEETIKKQKC